MKLVPAIYPLPSPPLKGEGAALLQSFKMLGHETVIRAQRPNQVAKNSCGITAANVLG
jgi:hypothetical protein